MHRAKNVNHGNSFLSPPSRDPSQKHSTVSNLMDSKEPSSQNGRHNEEWPVSFQTFPTFSVSWMDRVDASKKTVVDIRFFYRAVHYETKKGRRPRGRRKRGKAEDESDAREISGLGAKADLNPNGSTARGVLYMEHNAMGVVMAE